MKAALMPARIEYLHNIFTLLCFSVGLLHERMLVAFGREQKGTSESEDHNSGKGL
jgi:hypothetical protein